MERSLEILTHELRMLFRTRRVLVLLALYLGVGVLGGFGYAKSVQLGERAALDVAMEQGASEEEARQALEAAEDPARRQLLQAAAGLEGDQEIAPSLATSLVLPVFFWCSLAFLPLLILLTSFDHVSSELATRSFRYTTLRASRREILLGKAAAHLLLFAGLSAACSLALFGIAAVQLEGFDIVENAPGLLRVWLLLLPYAGCYLAISTFASCCTPRPFFALLLAFAITVVLRLAGALGGDPRGARGVGPASWLGYLSPAEYHDGLWLAGWTGPVLSTLAYCGFAAAFFALALTVLQRRDL